MTREQHRQETITKCLKLLRDAELELIPHGELNQIRYDIYKIEECLLQAQNNEI